MEVYCIVSDRKKLSEPTKKKTLQEPLAYNNAFAHCMRLTVLNDDGTDANLSGIGVTASMLRADGTTDYPIYGTVSGNVAEVVLPKSCYAVPGRFEFSMNLGTSKDEPTEGIAAFDPEEDYAVGAKVVRNNAVYVFVQAHTAGAWSDSDVQRSIITSSRTALWIEGHVQRNTSDTIVDPGTPVGNIDTAIQNATSAAAQAMAAAQAANEAYEEADGFTDSVAPDYADISFPISAGMQLCWHDGKVYVNNQDIATSENWKAEHWDVTTFADELTKCAHMAFDVASPEQVEDYLGI